MNVLILNNKFAKVFGGAVKAFSYVYHFLFPAKRFTIPAISPPRKKADGEQRIPRIVWQTNFTDKATLPLYVNYLFNRWLSPAYEFRFVSTEGRAEFIRENFPPGVYERYRRIQIGAGQADFWRVLVLLRCGGVYFDMDAHAVAPLERVIRPEDEELFLLMKDGRLTNYFIASAPDNPNLEKVARRIQDNIDANASSSIFEMTGPGAFLAVLEADKVGTAYYRYTALQGSFTNEYFQYMDKPEGKWTQQEQKVKILEE